ncbi:DDE superfamily endonuclease-domain-containing protein [Glomus cerebriforme]|uniref:DDE superfamily endonuclease-domain-containing protein n=1 Tax=Glomus cerebriforme TaxID=658196 RepID=A0A397SV92_9GLOM|nr:DDE superfamily endonuclease-domain-containing protein [Glomus cerebriforme]
MKHCGRLSDNDTTICLEATGEHLERDKLERKLVRIYEPAVEMIDPAPKNVYAIVIVQCGNPLKGEEIYFRVWYRKRKFEEIKNIEVKNIDMFINKKQISMKLEPFQIVKLHQTGISHYKIGVIYQRSERTIYRWKKGDKGNKRKLGRKTIISESILVILLSYVEKNNTRTQQEMSDYIYKETGVMISQQIISYTLRKNKITRKKITYHYYERSDEKIKEFKEEVKPLLNLPIYALDECSFRLGESPRYAYSTKGQRAVSQRMGKRSISYTLILCIQNISKNGVFGYELIEGGAKSKEFHRFLSKFDWKDKENFLLLDNARVHRATKSCEKLGLSTIRDLLVNKRIEPKHLPPYTPELNPTELCFNFLRQQIEKYKPRTKKDLEMIIAKIIDILNQKDMTKFFRKCFETDINFL